MTRACSLVLLFVATLSWHGSAYATHTREQARTATVRWLEQTQQRDGSWGSGSLRARSTAEALSALAAAGQGASPPARRAIAWLRGQTWPSVDARARALRALGQAGVDVRGEAAVLAALSFGAPGWGAVSGQDIGAYDTALALGAVHAAQAVPSPTFEAARLDELFRRSRWLVVPAGTARTWAGDFVPADAAAAGDRIVTAEVLRAVALLLPPTGPESAASPAIWGTLGSDPSFGGQAPMPETETIELATRVVALVALGRPVTAERQELLADARFGPSGVWSETDPLVNALGLLAVALDPSSPLGPLAPAGDEDGDGVPNGTDAFPFDTSETVDTDNDGYGDGIDPDRDGDGRCDPGATAQHGECAGSDAFPDDPRETVDTDLDGIGDAADLDDDGDGLLDDVELAYGTDPTRQDTDGDGNPDSTDPCKLAAGGLDVDGDAVCTPHDECPSDPLDVANTDGVGACDRLDEDDDEDGFWDAEELAWGSDPLDPSSKPPDLAATDPVRDFDEDGLPNGAEGGRPLGSQATSPFLADTDNDGATDRAEWGGAPRNPNLSPAPVAVAFSGMSPAPAPIGMGAGVQSSATGAHALAIGVAARAIPHPLDLVLLAGFQPQTLLGHDQDLDGVAGIAESRQSTSLTHVDSDGDGFADGLGNVVSVARHPAGFDLDANGFVDGEGDFATAASDPADHPGKRGDVAPLGRPDARITAADGLIALRLAATPSLADGLPVPARNLCLGAADAIPDGRIAASDALWILRQAETSPR